MGWPMPNTASTGSLLCLRCLARSRPCSSLPLSRTSRLSKNDFRPLQTGAAIAQDDEPVQEAPEADPPAAPPRRVKRRGKLRGPRGRELREHIARLDTHSLGSPVDVVMLKDAIAENSEAERGRKAAMAAAATQASEKGLSAEELVRSMNKEKAPVNDKAVVRNLDRLRPPSHTILNEQDYSQLAQKLRSGFTYAQLKAYVWQCRTKPKGVKLVVPGHIKGLEHTAAWCPSGGAPADGGSALDRSASGDPRKPSVKQRLVTRLMRECWSIKPESEVRSDGILVMRLRAQELSLFFDDQRHLLKQMAHRYRVDIEVARRTGSITIQGKEDNANAAAKEIERELEQVQRMSIDLEPLRQALDSSEARHLLTEGAHLQEIRRMTGTVVKFDNEQKTLRLCSLGPSRASVEDARRLLLSHLGALPKSVTRLQYDKTLTHEPTALYAIGAVSHLPWKDQARGTQATWARCRYRAPRHVDGRSPEPSSATLAESLPKHRRAVPSVANTLLQLFYPSRALGEKRPTNDVTEPGVPQQPAIDLASDEKEGTTWASETRTTLTACLGHVLHRTGSSQPVWQAPLRKLADRSSWYRTFSYDAPGLIGSMASLATVEAEQPQETLLLHLRPSPWTAVGGKPSVGLPAIEILLGVDPERRMNRLLKVEAVLEQHVVDAMMPGKATDLRFRTRSALELQDPGRCRSIEDFLDRSRLDVFGRERLETAPSLSMHIPRWILRPAIDRAFAKAAKELIVGDMIRMEYLFMGLEYRQAVDLAVNGWRARYASVEAGKAGGRWNELVMRMERAPSGNGSLEATEETNVGDGGAAAVPPNAPGPSTELSQETQDDKTVSHGPKPIIYDFVRGMYQFVDYVDQRVQANSASTAGAESQPKTESSESAPENTE